MVASWAKAYFPFCNSDMRATVGAIGDWFGILGVFCLRRRLVRLL